jgi:hypothetical protein
MEDDMANNEFVVTAAITRNVIAGLAPGNSSSQNKSDEDKPSFRGEQSANLRCAIAHRGISRFRVWSFGPSRNDHDHSSPERSPRMTIGNKRKEYRI